MTGDADRHYMERALALAERGRYTAAPNPRVGCVIVRDGRIVGEGWHMRAGGSHAEIHALEAAGGEAAGATAYVTLEPCAHHGQTPPCTDAMIDAGIARVVAAVEDPDERVAGRGLLALKQQGIEVTSGVLADAARTLNAGYMARRARGRPRVTIKLAMTLDGRTAAADGDSRWITGEAARTDVHRLRAASGAVVTGIGTVLADDPSLNVRLPGELTGPDDEPLAWPQPRRVILDSRLRCPPGARTLSLPGGVLVAAADAPAQRREALEAGGAEVLEAADDDGRVALDAVLERLAGDGVNDVLVEAGPTLAGAVLDASLADELVVYMAPALLGDAGRGLVHLPGAASMADRRGLAVREVQPVGADWRIIAVREIEGE